MPAASRSAMAALLCLVLACAWPAMAADNGPRAATPTTLFDLWFRLQPAGAIAWPYTYIRHRDTDERQQRRKQTLTEVLDDLVWRLQAAGRNALAEALDEWRRRIADADDFRTPGRWGPAALMAGPRNNPPVSAIAAIGACPVPDWVAIWSAQGVRRIPWTSHMRLSTLLEDGGALQGVTADSVSLITPYGEIHRRGIAAWNYRDAPLSPGTRIVVPLPLSGQAAVWIHDTLAEFLAHLVPSDDCRQLILSGESADPGQR